VSGAFNIAAEPVLDPRELADLMGARQLRVPAGVLRSAADTAWKLRLQPSPPGWVDMALNVPLMDVTRARIELGWEPRHSARDALIDLLNGLRDGSGVETPPLHPKAGGPARVREIVSGVGGTSR
jgi:nucleoside-diphosphate-sugar epimerase